LPGLHRAFESNDVALALRVFDHHNRVRTGWNCSSRHDLHASGPRQWFAHRIARFDLANALQSCAWRNFLCPHHIPIPRRPVKRRILPIRLHFLHQHQSQRIPHAHADDRARTYLISNMFDYVPACFFKGEHFK